MTHEEYQHHIRNWTIAWAVSGILLAITVALIVAALILPMLNLVYVTWPLFYLGWWWNKYYVDIYGEIAKASVDQYCRPGETI